MRIRIEGTPQELELAIDALRRDFEIGSVSRPYPNRNNNQYRVYIDAEPIPPEKESF